MGKVVFLVKEFWTPPSRGGFNQPWVSNLTNQKTKYFGTTVVFFSAGIGIPNYPLVNKDLWAEI